MLIVETINMYRKREKVPRNCNKTPETIRLDTFSSEIRTVSARS